ncbi:MAG: hypothetical protein KKF50_01015 [Nanoarchaeota archaeon]|nr:hypothetical protein [Nanoarchaeota archaeon]
MRWGKIVLLFQAVVTLIIGMIFFAQFLSIDHAKIEELRVEMDKGYIIWDDDAPPVMVDLKQRYSIAAYVLLIISVFEILLISRIVS